MATLSIQTVREAIATRIKTVCGIEAFGWLMPDDLVAYPRAEVLPAPQTINYHGTFGASNAMVDLNFIVRVLATAADPVSAQTTLSALMNPSSTGIKAALERVDAPALTPTLGGVVENINVDSADLGPGEDIGNNVYRFSATFRVAVRARSST